VVIIIHYANFTDYKLNKILEIQSYLASTKGKFQVKTKSLIIMILLVTQHIQYAKLHFLFVYFCDH